MSTSLSDNGFISVDWSESAGTSKPSVTLRTSFQIFVITTCQALSLRYFRKVSKLWSR